MDTSSTSVIVRMALGPRMEFGPKTSFQRDIHHHQHLQRFPQHQANTHRNRYSQRAMRPHGRAMGRCHTSAAQRHGGVNVSGHYTLTTVACNSLLATARDAIFARAGLVTGVHLTVRPGTCVTHPATPASIGTETFKFSLRDCRACVRDLRWRVRQTAQVASPAALLNVRHQTDEKMGRRFRINFFGAMTVPDQVQGSGLNSRLDPRVRVTEDLLGVISSIGQL